MAIILCIETGTSTCSVVLCDNGKQIALAEVHEDEGNHAMHLSLFIKQVLETGGIASNQLNALAVSMGPGSYTGLRIGVSTAKGLCYALGIPLIAINSLLALAQGALTSNPDLGANSLICSTIDARRMEVYTALFDTRLALIEPTQALILDSNSYSNFLSHCRVLFVGNGTQKVKAAIDHPNARFDVDLKPSARFMIPLATEMFDQKKFENVAYFEPYYLKDFVAKKPANKVLGNG